MTSSSITLSLTRIGLIVIPMSTATACGLSVGNKVRYEIIINKYNKYKKQYESDQVTIKSFDKLYRKCLQYYKFDENEYKSLCNILLNMLMKIKMNVFYKHEYKTKNKFS